MTYFTDSPFEKMMVKKPSGGREKAPTTSIKNKNPKQEKFRELIIVDNIKEDKKQ